VSEAGLERADSETLTVVLLFADCFDCGALNDKHGDLLGLE
jgi:hypothetical protein